MRDHDDLIDDDIEEPKKVSLKPALAKVAELFNLTHEEFINKTLIERQGFTTSFSPKLKNIQCTTVPGGRWGWPENEQNQPIGSYMRLGDTPVRLLVICPHPDQLAVNTCRLPVELLSPILTAILDNTDILPEEVYVTYAVPFYPPDGKLETPFVTAFKPILEEVIQRANPETILVLGASSLKALLGAKGIVDKVYGTSDVKYNDIPILYTIDPYKLRTNPKSILTLRFDLGRLISTLGGNDVPWDTVKAYKRYTTVTTPQELQEEIAKAFTQYAMNGCKLPLAVDLEWGNPDGREGILYDIVRYVQFSYEPHTATVVRLTNPDLSLTGTQEEHTAKLGLIKALFEAPGVSLCGHNFKVDLLHLYRMGIDCRRNFDFDTMTAFHYLEPQAAKIGLEELSLRYTDLGRYDLALSDYIKVSGLKKHVEAHGYSMIPDEILGVYSAHDVDAVIQARPILESELAGNLICEEYSGYSILGGPPAMNQLDAYLQVVKKADYGIFETEYYGIPVDRDLMVHLQKLLSEKLLEVKAKLDAVTNWPEFNPDSQQLRCYLFGRKYGTVKTEKSKVPEHIQVLQCIPIKTTGKYPTLWEDLEDERKDTATPATDNDSLKMMLPLYPEHAELLQLIIDYKAVNQVIKNFLRPPDDPEDEESEDEEVYSSGLIGKVDDDDHIRGTFLQTTETGRFRSLKPNLNNMSGGAAEAEVRKLFATSDELFKVPKWGEEDSRKLISMGVLDPRYDILRSIVRPSPGRVLLGSDLKTAEISVLAHIAKDQDLLSVVGDPDQDLHSSVAVKAFKIKVPDGESVKKYIKANYGNLRSAAKTVNNN